MIRLPQDFLTLLFPLRCCLCGGARVQAESHVCSGCLIRLPREPNYRGQNNNTSIRLKGLLKFDGAFSFLRFNKKSSVQRLLHQVKYKGNTTLAIQLGRWFAAEILYHTKHRFELVVPVPLHPDRLKARGYNQSQLIAQGISQVTGHKIVEALLRKPTKKTQTNLNRWQRFENTANEFHLSRPQEIINKRILLLDDVITTGATIAGSAVPLTKGGAASIVVAAVGLTQEQ